MSFAERENAMRILHAADLHLDSAYGMSRWRNGPAQPAARGLLRQYGEAICLWRMDVEAYRLAVAAGGAR